MYNKLLILFTLLIAISVNAETVYKTIDTNGNVEYSDTDSDGAEKIEVKEPSAISLPTPTFEPVSKNEEPVKTYKTLSIVSPKTDTTIHNNQGNVTIDFNIEPELYFGDRIVLFLDGKQVLEGNIPPFELSNIDRGAHTIDLAVVSADGKTIKRSNKVIYHLRRTSVLAPAHKANDQNSSVNPDTPQSGVTAPVNGIPVL